MPQAGRLRRARRVLALALCKDCDPRMAKRSFGTFIIGTGFRGILLHSITTERGVLSCEGVSFGGALGLQKKNAETRHFHQGEVDLLGCSFRLFLRFRV